ncbi:MAG: hypothetical protein ABJR05_04805 [Balneola sp.]
MNTLLLLGLTYCLSCTSPSVNIPESIQGIFQDDYNIEYELTAKVFYQKPETKFHILKWNVDEQYFISQNDSLNPYDPNLYSRVDWMIFENMEPYEWGFCLSDYNAITADSAEAVNVVDRSKPKTGCNGYPFSRMKPIIK